MQLDGMLMCNSCLVASTTSVWLMLYTRGSQSLGFDERCCSALSVQCGLQVLLGRFVDTLTTFNTAIFN